MSPTFKRYGTTIAMVVLAAVGLLVVFVQDRGTITTTERLTRKKNLLPAFREEEVGEMSITAQGKTARVIRGPADALGQRARTIEIDGAIWPAEEPAVDQLMASLRDGVVDHWVQGGAERQGEARAMIAVDMGKQRYRITLRGVAPTPPDAVYVEVLGGDAPMLGVITAQLAAVLGASPERLRRRALVTWGAADLASITLDGEGGPRRLVRADWPTPRGASFRFDGSTAEGRARASSAGLDRIWEGFAKLTADAFVRDADADAALDRKLTVTLAARSGEKTTIDLGGSCPGHADDIVAVRRDDKGKASGGPGPPETRVSACVPKGALSALSVPVAELLDRRLFAAHPEEVTDLKLAAGGPPIAMARTGSGWHEQAPTDRMIEPEVGKAFVERLLNVTATKLVAGDPKALGLDPPRATVRVVSLAAAPTDGGDAERTEIVEVGAEQGGIVHVRRVEDGVIAELPAEAAAPLLTGEIALRPRRIHDAAGAKFVSVRIEAPGRTQRIERDGEGRWVLAEPKGAGLAVDMSALGDLTDALGGLTADRWVGPAQPEHGLARPRLVVRAELDPEAGDAGKGRRTLEVRLGAPAGAAGSFARTGEDATVFVAPKRIEEAAGRWLVDRTALVVEMGSVRRVTLRAAEGKKVVLEAADGALRIAGAAADPAANARAAAVREALADFVAEGVATVGPPAREEGLDKPALEIEIEQVKKTSSPADQARLRLIKLAVGAGDTRDATRVFYVRREGVDATFAVAQAKVRPLLEAAAGK